MLIVLPSEPVSRAVSHHMSSSWPAGPSVYSLVQKVQYTVAGKSLSPNVPGLAVCLCRLLGGGGVLETTRLDYVI